MLNVVILSVIIMYVVLLCCYSECRYAECPLSVECRRGARRGASCQPAVKKPEKVSQLSLTFNPLADSTKLDELVSLKKMLVIL
jgi:hypothetical protein